MDKVRNVLELRHVSKIYGSGHTAVTATDAVNLAIRPGEVVLIMGPSGSGKTTLLSMVGLLLQPTKGHILIDGRAIVIVTHDPRMRQMADRTLWLEDGHLTTAAETLPA